MKNEKSTLEKLVEYYAKNNVDVLVIEAYSDKAAFKVTPKDGPSYDLPWREAVRLTKLDMQQDNE